MRHLRLVLAMTVMASVIMADHPSSFRSPDGTFRASWAVVEGGKSIRFTMEAVTMGWVSIGFAAIQTGHTNANSLIGWVDATGAVTFIETMSTARSLPLPTKFLDATEITGSEAAGVTTISFARPLAALDAGHVDLQSPKFLIWAYGLEDGTNDGRFPQHLVTTRGITVDPIDMAAAVAALPATSPSSSPPNLRAVALDLTVVKVTDAGFGMTLSVSAILLLLAIIQGVTKLTKLCQESRRRKAFRGFVGARGFLDPDPTTMPSGLRAGSPGLRPVKTLTRTLQSAGSPRPIGYGTGLSERANPSELGGFKAPLNRFPFQERMFVNVDLDDKADEDPCASDDVELMNVVPSGVGYFKGAEMVKYPEMNESELPVEVVITEKKPLSGSLKNAFMRLYRARLFNTQIAFKDAFLFAVYMIINIGWVFIWAPLSWDKGNSLGSMIAANAFWVAVPASRNSVLSSLLRIPINRSIAYHRWLGRWIVVVATAHGVVQIYPQIKSDMNVNNQIMAVLMNQTNLTGLIAYASLLVILFTSIESIRRQLYNFFYYVHFAFIIFYVYIWMHHVRARPYIIAAIAIYALDRIFRLLRGNVIPVRAIEAQTLAGNVVRLRFARARYTRYRAGQYVYLNFPSIALLEWHPFSLSSGPYDDLCEVHIKSLGNTTQALLNSVTGSLSVIPPLMRVEGPYGRLSSRYKRYSHVVLIGGGVGITPLISILKDIYQLEMSAKSKSKHARSAWIRRVILVWSVPTEIEWSWFAETIVKARVLSTLAHYPTLTVAGHITKQKETADRALFVGRPQLDIIFRYIEDTMTSEQASEVAIVLPSSDVVNSRPDSAVAGRAVVYACGPRQMVNQAWDITRQRTRGNLRYDFHHEIFEL